MDVFNAKLFETNYILRQQIPIQCLNDWSARREVVVLENVIAILYDSANSHFVRCAVIPYQRTHTIRLNE